MHSELPVNIVYHYHHHHHQWLIKPEGSKDARGKMSENRTGRPHGVMWIVAAGRVGKEVGSELKQKTKQTSFPTIQECTEAPVDTSQVPGTQHWPKPAGGPGTELQSSFPSGVEPGAFACLPYCAQRSVTKCRRALGEEPPHIPASGLCPETSKSEPDATGITGAGK